MITNLVRKGLAFTKTMTNYDKNELETELIYKDIYIDYCKKMTKDLYGMQIPEWFNDKDDAIKIAKMFYFQSREVRYEIEHNIVEFLSIQEGHNNDKQVELLEFMAERLGISIIESD